MGGSLNGAAFTGGFIMQEPPDKRRIGVLRPQFRVASNVIAKLAPEASVVAEAVSVPVRKETP